VAEGCLCFFRGLSLDDVVGDSWGTVKLRWCCIPKYQSYKYLADAIAWFGEGANKSRVLLVHGSP
jgi:hypothetical protein